MYKLYKNSKNSQARLGTLTTRHGKIKTPFFMPVATVGALKTLTTEDVRRLKPQILLANTYHLYLRPGILVMKKARGLHNFMDWQGPILTDSGGYQVFSLAGIKPPLSNFPFNKGVRKGGLVKIQPEGVRFSSHIDGSKHLFTPKKVLEIQATIGSDIMMVLDVCTKNPSTHVQAAHDLALTHAWAKQSKEYKLKNKHLKSLLFGIVQGSTFRDLRIESARTLAAHDFDGYAIGGLAVGETAQEMYEVLEYTVPELPMNRPRYLMGVGKPENIVEAVKRGVDMFDCVIPTREARHGRLYQWRVQDVLKKNFYHTINIANAKWQTDFTPINKDSKLPELKTYTRAYLYHLYKIQEPLAQRLATLNNVEFYLRLMDVIRRSIKSGKL